MNIKQIFQTFFVGAALLFAALTPVFLTSTTVLAADCDPLSQNCCGGVETALITCDETGGDTIEDTGLWGVLVLAINILTGLVAVAALGGIVWGAILYTSAGGNMEQTKKALGIITNVVIGIVAYGLMYVGLNFLVPGGVFN